MNLSIEGRTRIDILSAACKAGRKGAHIAPSLSIVEIMLAVLNIYSETTDTIILSKGHGALGYYASMHQLGMIDDIQFDSFEANGGDYPGQPSRSENNRIDYSSGSLGMGLSYGVGRACGNKAAKVFVVMGDGELNEGSNWEAAALAKRLNLSNLYAIVDMNGLQSDGFCQDILNQDYKKIWNAFGWNVVDVDGHDTEQIIHSFDKKNDSPTVILAKTTKGKGVTFMEQNNEWHHHELSTEMFEAARHEIEQKYAL